MLSIIELEDVHFSLGQNLLLHISATHCLLVRIWLRLVDDWYPQSILRKRSPLSRPPTIALLFLSPMSIMQQKLNDLILGNMNQILSDLRIPISKDSSRPREIGRWSCVERTGNISHGQSSILMGWHRHEVILLNLENGLMLRFWVLIIFHVCPIFLLPTHIRLDIKCLGYTTLKSSIAIGCNKPPPLSLPEGLSRLAFVSKYGDLGHQKISCRNPIRCFSCLRFGHSITGCKNLSRRPSIHLPHLNHLHPSFSIPKPF